MAEPNWEAYAQAYGGQNQGQQQAGQALGSAIGRGFGAIPNVMDRLAQSQGEGLDNAFAPLLGLVNKDVESWGNVDKIPSAGEAYMKWTSEMSPRQKRMARRKGILNPIAYKQQYDAQMEMYLPVIKQKIETYKTLGNKSDKSMRKFLSSKQGLNEFLLQNTSLEEQALSPYLKPEETWKQWWEDKGVLGKAGTIAGPPLTAAYGYSVAKDIGKRGLGGRYNPMGKKSVLGMTDKGTATAVKELGWKGKTTALDKKAMKSAKNAQSKASRAVTDAKKLYEKKPRKYTRGVNKGKAIPWKKTKQFTNLAKTQEAAKLSNIAAKKGAAKGPTRVVASYVKKHGVSGLMKKVIAKAGWKGAAKLLGKGALSIGLKGTGVGALASLALDATTIYSIYSMITSED